MAELMRMCLTDDESLTFQTRRGPVPARIRIWRNRERVPIVLVEPTTPLDVAPFACQIGCYIHHCLLKGRIFCYVEHDHDGVFGHVTFTIFRHCYTQARRFHVERGTIEDAIGGEI